MVSVRAQLFFRNTRRSVDTDMVVCCKGSLIFDEFGMGVDICCSYHRYWHYEDNHVNINTYSLPILKLYLENPCLQNLGHDPSI